MKNNMEKSLMGYVMTNQDRMAINELLQVTYSFQLQGSQERGVSNHMQFSLTAPGRNRTHYTSNGFSIVEAIDNWYDRVIEVEGISLKRVDKGGPTSLHEAKAHTIDITKAQFYG
jgi:hypothetical protein